MSTTSETLIHSGSFATNAAEKPQSNEDAVYRLMSETAHDLRSPLTTIREAIRLVHDGDFGDVNEDQIEILSAAIDQCHCVDQMVGEMTQIDRLRSGLPRVRRQWASVVQIRQSIVQTLRPWAIPRDIRILWDGANDPQQVVYGDPGMLRRLVVNLVTNAIRVTAEGDSVMIRVRETADRSGLQWSVIDQGPGISELDLQKISQRHVSMRGGEGLGLSISRQLSAVHFSNLQIQSQVNEGTSVSFLTPAGGPDSVAKNYVSWRLGLSPHANNDAKMKLTTIISGKERQVRIDNPMSSVVLFSDGCQPKTHDQVSVGTVELGTTVPSPAAESFNELLQNKLSMFDLAYRTGTRSWVWVFDADDVAAERRIDEIHSVAVEQAPEMRLRWTQPFAMDLADERTPNRLRDILVRQALLAARSRLVISDHNQVRLGTTPLEASPVASLRLDREVKRLTSRITNLARQAEIHNRRLTPPVSISTP